MAIVIFFEKKKQKTKSKHKIATEGTKLKKKNTGDEKHEIAKRYQDIIEKLKKKLKPQTKK